jgi:hypothetical protein
VQRFENKRRSGGFEALKRASGLQQKIPPIFLPFGMPQNRFGFEPRRGCEAKPALPAKLIDTVSYTNPMAPPQQPDCVTELVY